jgi:hypothetical protein
MGKKINCPFRQKWRHMINRCKDESFLRRNPTYAGCSVCDEWLIFDNFKSWMQAQDWKGKQLDKDLLIEGNKVYSPQTCLLVSHSVNSFMTDHRAARGDYPIGVSLDCGGKRFRARCRNPFTKKQESLGSFFTPEDANRAWMAKKSEFAFKLADLQNDEKVANALRRRYA